MTGLDLLSKRELWIVGVRLAAVDLTRLAAAAADVLKLAHDEIFVTDVRDEHLVFDIVAPAVDLEAVAGREQALLKALGTFDGVTLRPGAAVHSHGVLGIIGAPADQAAGIISAASRLDADLRAFVSRSVAILSTGPEIANGDVEDTNLAAARELLGGSGYHVTAAGAVADDEELIAGRVRHLLEEGFGLIVTTGGVGAEDKDRTIEALQRIAPDLSTAVLASYAVGHGRHVKPHVRVACGRAAGVTLVALPGPTREVRAALPALVAALAGGLPQDAIADAVAEPIRDLWRAHRAAGHAHGPHR